MEKYKKYYGVIIFLAALVAMIALVVSLETPKISELKSLKNDEQQKQEQVNELQGKLDIVKAKIKKIKNSITSSQKKIYSPIENDLGNETLFFTLYNDVIEMIHANSVKIKSIDYTYNPETDAFVKFGKDVYFVCDVNMELVSNYVNLGKLIQDLYQYPYYIRINELEVKPYEKDKKILISNLSLRLYAHTEPDSETPVASSTTDALPLNGAETQLPQ